MGGFLSGLGTLLGGFNAARRIDKEGFDYREKQAQEDFLRQRQQEVAQQQNEDRLLSQLTDMAAGQEGDLSPEQVSQMIPERVDQAQRKRLAMVALGRIPERKSSIEASKAYSQFQRDLLRGDQRSGEIAQRGDEAQELAVLREKQLRERTLSPAEQARMEALDKRAALGRANARGIAGMGTLRPLLDDQGKVTGYYNNKTGETMPAPEGASGMRTSAVAPAEREKRAALQGMIEDAQYLSEIAPKHRDAIGKLQGTATDIKQRFIGGDPESIDLFSISDNLGDQLLRARSGAQINEKEYARLRRITPNPRESEDKFFADLRRFQFELNRLLEQRTAPEPGITPTSAQRETGPLPQEPTGLPHVSSAEEYAALPSGTTYIDPNGKVRRKK